MLRPMKLRSLGLFLGLALFALFAVWFFVSGPRPTPRPAEAHVPEPVPQALESIEELPVEPAAPASWPDRAPRTLFGHVMDAEGTPITSARVVVEVGGKQVASGRSDPEGAYRLREVPPKPSRIRVEAPGYRPHIDERPKLPSGRDVQWDVVLEAIPGVRGRVVAGGQPVVGARVGLLAAGVSGPAAQTRSDDAGRFFLPWPEGGASVIMAFHPHHGRETKPVSGPGEIEIELIAGVFIEGRVVDQAGAPVERFSLSIKPLVGGPGSTMAQSFESEEGTFRMGPVAAGGLEVYAAAEGYQPAEKKGLAVDAGDTLRDVVLVLKASVQLEGRVTDAKTGEPIEGATVIPAEWKAGELAEMVGTETDADGRYRLTALPGTRTSIRVKAEGYRSVLAGGVEGQPGARLERDFPLTPQPTNQRPASELTGVGAVLARHPDGVRIAEVIGGGSAEAALKPGDVVVAVDGEPIRGRGMDVAAQAIRGEEGSEVELMVRRGGEGEPEPVILRRGRVTLPDRHHDRN